MGWFSNNFPTVARLFSVISNGVAPRRRSGVGGSRGARGRRTPQLATNTEGGLLGATEAAAAEAVAEPSAAIEQSAQAQGISPSDTAAGPISPEAGLPHVSIEMGPAVGWEPGLAFGQEPSPEPGPQTGAEALDHGDQSARIETSAHVHLLHAMERMYSHWVELEETIAAARAELETLLSKRKAAEGIRGQARDMMAQAEAAWAEAARLGEAAKQAFQRGFTVNLPGFATRLRMFQEIELARLAQVQLVRSNNANAWEEVERTRQNATTELMKAVTAVAAASSQVDRELREAESLPVSAESLRSSALEDLNSAKVVNEELGLLGRDAFNLLGAATGPLTEVSARQAEIQGSVGDSPPLQDFRGRPGSEPTSASTPQVPDRPEGQVVAPGPSPEAEAPEAPMSVAEQLRKEFEASTSAPPESTGQTINRGANGGVIEAGPAPEGASGAPLSVAEELERDLASLRPISADSEPATAGAPEPSGQAQAGAPTASSDDTPSPTSPDSYSGRLYIMFPASLDQDQIGLVWEALDEVAGSGAIIDSRLISREAGIQFTLDLKNKTLAVEDLRKRMPGAGIVALGEDRLKSDWHGRG